MSEIDARAYGKARNGPPSVRAMQLRTLRDRIRRLATGKYTRRAMRTLDAIMSDTANPPAVRVSAARGLLDFGARMFAGSTEPERRPIVEMIRQASEAHAMLLLERKMGSAEHGAEEAQPGACESDRGDGRSDASQ